MAAADGDLDTFAEGSVMVRHCGWCGRNGRAPAPPACGALRRSSRSTWHAGGTRWGRRCSKRSCRLTTDLRQRCPSRAATWVWRSWTASRRSARVVDQLGRALEVIQRHSPARIVTLGGECSVSVAPFSELAAVMATIWRSYGSTHIPTSAPGK